MMRKILDRMNAARAQREQHNALRRRRIIEAREGALVRVNGRDLVNFCSNDYLGLSQHLDVVSAFQESAAWNGAGSTGSPLVCGFHREHDVLEHEAAEWMGYERALFFGSGYQANLAVIQAILEKDDICVQDKLNHACLLDGARLAEAELKRYPHLDSGAALRQLMGSSDRAKMLVTDGVFSMDGDIAPLHDLALVAKTCEAMLVVDEAHSAGVMGPDGRGAAAAAGLGPDEVPMLVVPLGKAFGGQGALVFGNKLIIGHLLETARPYLYSTAPVPAIAAAMRASLRLIKKEPWRRAKLQSLVARFRRGALRLELPLMDSFTAIQPLLFGDNDSALKAAQKLEARGFLLTAIRPPTVAEGKARLRVTLSASHDEAQIDALLEALAEVRDRNPVSVGS